MATTSLLTAAATAGSRHSIQSNGSNHARFITNLHNYDYLNNNGRHSMEVVDNAPALAARRSCSFPRSNRSSTSEVAPQHRSTSIGARIKKFFKNALSRPKPRVTQEVEVVTSEESSVSNTPQQTHTPMSISDGTPLSSTSSSRATLSTPATPQKKTSSMSIPGIALLPSSPVIPGKRLRPPPSPEDIAKSKSLPANTKPPTHPYDGGGPSKIPTSRPTKSKSAKTLSPDAKSQSPRSRLPKLKSLSPLLIKSRLMREDRERTRSRSSTSSLSDCNTVPSSPAPSSCSASSSGTRSYPATSSLSSTSSQGYTRIPRLAQKCANFGPADYNYDETISTLRYANRAKNIKNKAKINEDPKDALLRQFQKEIDDLKKQLEEGGIEMGEGEESGSEEESDEEGGGGTTTTGGKRRKKKGKKGLSKEKMVAIQQQIEADRKKLEEQKDMEEEEKKKIEEDLESKESELKKAQEEQEALQHKLVAIEKKIIVGGENLLEKAEEQERLLEESAKELEARRRKEEELRKQLAEKEQERLDIEEKYSNLQEEVAGKTKKLKKVWTMLMQAKSEMADLQQEHQREMEGLLENVRQLSRELHLQMLIIDSFIPPEYQEMIEQYVHWNEDIGEWQLKCVAYTGNNMRKQSPIPDKDKERFHEPDLSHVYLAYTAEGAEQALRPKASKSKSGRPKTANRPKTSKKKRKDQEAEIIQ